MKSSSCLHSTIRLQNHRNSRQQTTGALTGKRVPFQESLFTQRRRPYLQQHHVGSHFNVEILKSQEKKQCRHLLLNSIFQIRTKSDINLFFLFLNGSDSSCSDAMTLPFGDWLFYLKASFSHS